jgi:hypothetical protein
MKCNSADMAAKMCYVWRRRIPEDGKPDRYMIRRHNSNSFNSRRNEEYYKPTPDILTSCLLGDSKLLRPNLCLGVQTEGPTRNRKQMFQTYLISVAMISERYTRN